MTVYIALDTETTGLDTNRCEVIDLAAVVLDPVTLMPRGDADSIFNKKFHPQNLADIEPGVLGVKNHYNTEIWTMEAVSQAEGWAMFCDWLFKVGNNGLNRVTPVGHNIIKFDQPVIEKWYKHFAFKPNLGYIPEDTMYQYIMACQMLGEKEVGKFGLAKVASEWGITFDTNQAHGAFYDALVAGCCYGIGRAYMEAMVDCGRHPHKTLVDEAWRRVGLRPNLQPLPVR